MIYSASTPADTSFESSQAGFANTVQAEYAGKREPTPDALSSFTFEQKIIPLEGGNQTLRLRKPLELLIDPASLHFTVKDWGIEMDCLKLGELPRQVARKFMRLLNAAENERLTEHEQAEWLAISDYLDFQQFSIDRAAPRYMEGVLRTRGELVIVDWHDGSTDRLVRRTARALSDLNPGERFSAFVKLGRDDQPLAIERVSLLGEPEKEDDWGSWPEQN